jgi:hypothetical protein
MQETSAQWSKRLRREQPAHVFFIDDELRDSLGRAAERCGVTVPGLIKKVLMAWLHDQRKV